MNAREKRDPAGRALTWAVAGVSKRHSRQNSLECLLGGDFPTGLDGEFTGPAEVARESAPRRSQLDGTGKTPHAAESPAFATALEISDEFGISPITHPLIVITGDEPAAVAEATAALRAYRNPLEAAFLASLLNGPADQDKPEQSGGSGMIPPTQTMVFSKPGCSSSLRIRVVPISATWTPLIPYAEWSRTIDAGDRRESGAKKTSQSRWLNGS
jgi:hypothetical protein